MFTHSLSFQGNFQQAPKRESREPTKDQLRHRQEGQPMGLQRWKESSRVRDLRIRQRQDRMQKGQLQEHQQRGAATKERPR